MQGRNIAFGFLYFVWLISGSYSLTYLHDPSSLNLSCNPYGSEIKLTCTVQEPATLVSPLSFLILWYWSGNGDMDLTTLNGCQLYPSYQCTRYIGPSKYMFEFSRYQSNETLEGGNPIMYRTLKLTIRNITSSDKGCYYCRPWIHLSPLNETSGMFCLEPKNSYENLTPCVKDDISSIASSEVISTQTIMSSSKTPCVKDDISSIASSEVISTQTIMSSSSEFIMQSINTLPIISTTDMPIGSTGTPALSSPFFLQPTIWPNDSSTQLAGKHMGLWVYGCIALCIVLGISTILLTIVTIILTRNGKKNKNKNNEGHNIVIYQQPTGYENRIINPSTVIHQPNIIGTYSYVRPTSSIQSPQETLQYNTDNNSIIQETNQLSDRQIYKTLNKHIEELEYYNSTRGSNDRLFDDPNYSPVRVSHALSLIEPPDNSIYDKLATTDTNCGEYSYTYVCIPGRQRKSQVTLKEEVKESEKAISDNNHELLRIAALGRYEINPKLISTLKGNQTSDVAMYAVPLPSNAVSPPKIIQNNSGKGKTHQSNCYQSLDKNTLAPDNSYMCTTVNK